jgi:hypothetical protein
MTKKIKLKQGDTLYYYSTVSIGDIKNAIPQAKQASFEQSISKNLQKRTVGEILKNLQIDIKAVTSSLACKIEQVSVVKISAMRNDVPNSEYALLSNGQKINPDGNPLYKSTEKEALAELKKIISDLKTIKQ